MARVLLYDILQIVEKCRRNTSAIVKMSEFSSLDYFRVNYDLLATELNDVYNTRLSASQILKCNVVKDIVDLVSDRVSSSTQNKIVRPVSKTENFDIDDIVSEVVSVANSCWRRMPQLEIHESSSIKYFGIELVQFAEKLNKRFKASLSFHDLDRCETIIDVAKLVARRMGNTNSFKKSNASTSQKAYDDCANSETLKSKEQVEHAYEAFATMLDNSRRNISSLQTINPNFTTYQEAYKEQLTNLIDGSRKSLDEVKKYAIWDKLVVAFIGVTNAGKSTIIETFRILFDEPERREALKKCPSGVDGTIIGDGRPDYTREYKEYNMSISGKPFVLIDVPGIEGDEGAVKTEILKALSKAHCVFFIQGEGKKPDTGTALKIKEYLKDWVKVYSIYNVKGSAFNYEDEEERATLITRDNTKVGNEIIQTMTDALGRNYAGNIIIQARLALCAHAKFARGQKELIGEQNDLMQCFGNADKMYSFSMFKEIVDKINYLSSHFSDEILEAQRKKIYKLYEDAFNEVNSLNKEKITDIDRLINRFGNCKNHVNHYFDSSQQLIVSKIRREITSMFNKLEAYGCKAIDEGYEGDDLKRKIESEQSRVSRIAENNIKYIVNNGMTDLQANIRTEIQRLKESFNMRTFNGSYSTNFNFNIDNVIGELEFGFGDLCNWGGLIVSAGFLLFNFWNPIAWIGLISSLFGFWGNNKKDKAKSKFREGLAESKNDFFNNKWYDISRRVNNQFDSKKGTFDSQIDSITSDFKSLKKQMNQITDTIVNNSRKFK